MREKWVRLWRDFRFPLMVAFGTVPIPLWLFADLAPTLLPYLWILPLIYVLLDGLGTRIPGKGRIGYAVGIVLVWCVAGYIALRFASDWQILFVPAMYCILLLRGLAMSSNDRNDQIKMIWYGLCITIHLFIQLKQYSAQITDNPALDPIHPWTAASFFIFAILSLITLNQANLTASTYGRQDASQVMRRKNLLMVLALFLLGVLIACIPSIVDAVRYLLQWLIYAILWLILFLYGREPPTQESGGSSTDMSELMALDAERTDAMPEWLSIVITVIVLIVAAAAVGYGLYFLGKKLIVFIKYLTRVSEKYLHTISEDYVDEITDTRLGQEDQSKTSSRKRRLSAIDERRLPPDQRIRYRYRKLMQKNPQWHSGSTARENLPSQAAPIYERVRYSPHPVTEADAEFFSVETKKL